MRSPKYRSSRIVPLPLRIPACEVALIWHDRVHRDPANAWLRAEVLASRRD